MTKRHIGHVRLVTSMHHVSDRYVTTNRAQRRSPISLRGAEHRSPSNCGGVFGELPDGAVGGWHIVHTAFRDVIDLCQSCTVAILPSITQKWRLYWTGRTLWRRGVKHGPVTSLHRRLRALWNLPGHSSSTAAVTWIPLSTMDGRKKCIHNRKSTSCIGNLPMNRSGAHQNEYIRLLYGERPPSPPSQQCQHSPGSWRHPRTETAIWWPLTYETGIISLIDRLLERIADLQNMAVPQCLQSFNRKRGPMKRLEIMRVP